MKCEKQTEKNVKLIVEIPQSLRKELKSKAALEEIPIKNIIIKLIKDYLKKENKKN